MVRVRWTAAAVARAGGGHRRPVRVVGLPAASADPGVTLTELITVQRDGHVLLITKQKVADESVEWLIPRSRAFTSVMGATAGCCDQVKPTFRTKCPSRRLSTPPPAQCC